MYLGRLGQAQETLRRAADRRLEMPDFVVQRYDLAFLKSDDAAMALELALAQSDPEAEDWISHHEAFVLAYTGHVREARKLSVQAGELARQGHRERAALFETGAALREAFIGNAAAARQRASVALELARGREVQYGTALALALASSRDRKSVV